MYLYLKCNFTTSSCMSECQLILTNKSNAWRAYKVWDGCADMTRTSAVGGRAARRSCLSGRRLGGGRQAATMTWSQSPKYCCTGSTQTHCRWDERWAEMTRNCAGVDDDLNLTIRVVFHLTSAETRSVRVNSTQWAFHITSAVSWVQRPLQPALERRRNFKWLREHLSDFYLVVWAFVQWAHVRESCETFSHLRFYEHTTESRHYEINEKAVAYRIRSHIRGDHHPFRLLKEI